MVEGIYELISVRNGGYDKKWSTYRMVYIIILSCFFGIFNLFFTGSIFIGIIWLIGSIIWFRNLKNSK